MRTASSSTATRGTACSVAVLMARAPAHGCTAEPARRSACSPLCGVRIPVGIAVGVSGGCAGDDDPERPRAAAWKHALQLAHHRPAKHVQSRNEDQRVDSRGERERVADPEHRRRVDQDEVGIAKRGRRAPRSTAAEPMNSPGLGGERSRRQQSEGSLRCAASRWRSAACLSAVLRLSEDERDKRVAQGYMSERYVRQPMSSPVKRKEGTELWDVGNRSRRGSRADPARAAATARLATVVDFPSPSTALVTMIVFAGRSRLIRSSCVLRMRNGSA